MFICPSAPVLKQGFASLLSLSLHLSMGICHGFSAVLLPQLQAKNSTLPINDDDASWIASTSMVTMPISALMVGILMDIVGRRRTVQLAYIPLSLGWAIISLADSVFLLCVGRVITGIAVGMDPAVNIYIAETNCPRFRGIYLSLTGPLVIIGILVSYLLGHYLYWKQAAIVVSIFSVLCGTLLFTIPESPVWLLLKGRNQEASDSLLWFHGEAQRNSELKALQDARAKQSSNAEEPILRRLIDSKAWRPLGILAFFFYLHQFCGSGVIFYYAVNFFQSLDSQMDSFMVSIVYIIVGLVASITCTLVIERYNRKTLTITSAAGMCMAYAVAGIYEYLLEDVAERPFTWLPTVCTWISVAFSAIGLWPLPWLMTGELLPLKVRGFLSGVLWTISYFFMFVTVKLYPISVAYLGIYGVLGVFSFTALIAVPFGRFILPETRGKTLIEIENSWQ